MGFCHTASLQDPNKTFRRMIRVLQGVQSSLSGQQQSPGITMKAPKSQVVAEGGAHQPSLPRTDQPGTTSHSPPDPGSWEGLHAPLGDLKSGIKSGSGARHK